jgi:predicted nuclease of predicted toxin-antitoxin system
MILLLLDQGLPRSLVSTLEAREIKSIHVGNIGMATATDAEIVQKAIDLDATVVTFDSDFHSILAHRNGKVPSVLRIRVEGLKAPDLATILHEAIRLTEQDIVNGAAITITKKGIRVHRLPF